MYTLSFLAAKSNVQYAFSYKHKGTAEAQRENVHKAQQKWIMEKGDSQVVIKDDFGHVLDVAASDIAALLMEDLAESYRCAFDREIIKRRCDQEFMARRANDNELMRLFPAQAGPAMPGLYQ